MKTGAVLLAAGFSHRFGAIKLKQPMADGRTVLQQTLLRLHAAIPDIILVTRQSLLDAGVLGDMQLPESIRLALCPDADRGMGHSLAFGAGRLGDRDGCLVCLADMPFIRSETYAHLQANLQPDRIVMPRCQGRYGNPAGFGSAFFAELGRCRGDSGARAVIQAHSDCLRAVEVDDPAVHRDIDTPEDLETP